MAVKFTDEQIIEALKHCVKDVYAHVECCSGCPMNNGECDRDLYAVEKYALDLINRHQDKITAKDVEINNLKNEIKRLQNKMRLQEHTIKKYEFILDDKQDLIDFLRTQLFKQLAGERNG